MRATTDGRGEFILNEGNQNLYEEAANAAEDFATLQSLNPTQTGQGQFDLMYTYSGTDPWPTGTERRVVVRSRHVYGKRRRIRDLKIEPGEACDCLIAMTPNTGMTEARIAMRAITTEFDPASATWDWAYGQGQLGLSEGSAIYMAGTTSGATEAAGMPGRKNIPLDEWNELEAIYGFELRVEPAGSPLTWMQVTWKPIRTGVYIPVAYAITA